MLLLLKNAPKLHYKYQLIKGLWENNLWFRKPEE